MSFLNEVKWAPFRPIDDFLTSSARFKVPDYTNLERWNNRVVQNFLYYQTNYFVLTALVYALFIFINPQKTILGLVVLGALIWILYQYTPNLPNRQENDKKFGLMCGVVVACFVGLAVFSAVTYVLLMLLLPIALCFVHASLRLRNIKNKMANLSQLVGVKNTPMDFLFSKFQMTQSEWSIEGVN
ncbi:hypothetical protein HA402_014872 [Bradysia odoriphaga]|nr:hypothetical protein HA402_014872 [Bradysia odoriphaga]